MARQGNWPSPMTRRQLISRCHTCVKWSYPDRQFAKNIRKELRRTANPGAPVLNVYRCPQNREVWHIGHDHGDREAKLIEEERAS